MVPRNIWKRGTGSHHLNGKTYAAGYQFEENKRPLVDMDVVMYGAPCTNPSMSP